MSRALPAGRWVHTSSPPLGLAIMQVPVCAPAGMLGLPHALWPHVGQGPHPSGRPQLQAVVRLPSGSIQRCHVSDMERLYSGVLSEGSCCVIIIALGCKAFDVKKYP